MMSTWMLYAIGAASLLGVAGLALERVALATGRETRWVWLAALAASLILPFALPRMGTGGGATEGAEGMIGPIEVLGLAPDGSSGGGALWYEQALLFGWIGASAVLLVLFAGSVAVLKRRRRQWRRRVVAGTAVLVSERTGPALVGFLAPDLVIPAWMLGWDEDSLRLLMVHEREHQYRGDPLLLLAAIGVLIILPWNLPLWWQARRLRLAIEVDCDSRVLGRYADARAYGRLLLEVGSRASVSHVPVAAFSEPTSFLERRIRVLGRRPAITRRAAFGACLLAAAAPIALYALPVPAPPRVAAVIGAQGGAPVEAADPAASPTIPVDAPGPVRAAGDDAPTTGGAGDPPDRPSATLGTSAVAIWTRPEPDRGARTPATAAVRDTIPGEPRYTPYDRPPELMNRQEFAAALGAAYPPEAKAAGVEGTTVLWVYIGEDGVVRDARVTSPAGDDRLDDAARRVMMTARFTPALNKGEPVPVWIQLPITFRSTHR